MAGAALQSLTAEVPPTGVALPLTSGTIQTSDVPMTGLLQTTHSPAGSSEGLTAMQPADMQPIGKSPMAMLLAAMQHTAMQLTAMPLMVTPFIMTHNPIHMGLFAGVSLNIQGTQFLGSYMYMHMPNPGWQVTQKEQILQEQLQRERQQFGAWKLEMENKILTPQSQVSHPQVQAPPISSGPSTKINDLGDVETKSGRSVSSKRSRSRDQAPKFSKPARCKTVSSHRSLSPQTDYPRGTSTVTKPSQVSPKQAEDRPVQAQDLASFKSDMTTLIKDMIQSSLSTFASQFKSDSGDKGKSSQDQAHKIS